MPPDDRVTDLLLLACAGYVAWLIGTLSGGDGAMLLIPVINWVTGRPEAVAPVIAMATLIDAPVRVRLFWRHVRWDVVGRVLPGAVAGAVVGGYVFARTGAPWLKVLAGLVLISTVLHYGFGARERSFRMRLWAFTPVEDDRNVLPGG